MTPLVVLFLCVALTSGAPPQGAPAAWLLGRPEDVREEPEVLLPKSKTPEVNLEGVASPRFFDLSSPVALEEESLMEAMQEAAREMEGGDGKIEGQGTSLLQQDPPRGDYTELGPKTDGGANDLLQTLWLSRIQEPPQRLGSVVDLFDTVASSRGFQPLWKRAKHPARKLSTLPSMPERRSARRKAACGFNAFRLVCWHSRSRAAMYRDKNRQ